ncbi:CDP-alcohol phosphatidyltransferase family protein [Miltoncostaea marina]|uniref:CDP-alcohol phosphatidyltransferase family protein n=1 Tax=Miltoncostaea marina TaxID=2843215 RepID=UPI001C3E132B|nr:CDP-alcohol phosphatidyltransferase family protein [Miltoncostaea marina]
MRRRPAPLTGAVAISTQLDDLDPGTPARRSASDVAWRIVDRSGITPNAITILGFLGICGAAWLALERYWVLSSLVFIASGLVDSLDGLVARHQGRVTAFGAFLDSTLDRLAEGVILGAIGVTLAQDGQDWAVAACFVALTASFLVSYARARAEGLGIPGSSGGLMGRPERLVIVGAALFLGGLGDLLPVSMAILAGLSLMTAVHRVAIVWMASDGRGG